jgi:zinc protease
MSVVPSARLLAAAPMVAAVLGSEPFSAAPIPDVSFTDTRLNNGLRVIVAEDQGAPVVSIAVAYNVGSRDERAGRTGVAHLFEHMMFKGSANVGSGEHLLLVLNNGGNMNGNTSKERTLYFETLPANQLDLALFLEADRMSSLDITQENLDNQRLAVQEERRLMLDNQPYGRTGEAIEELAYDSFAYEHSAFGSMQDLNSASVDDVASFFRTYYAPNNAVLAIVGDVKAADALARVQKYFAAIPPQPPPPQVEFDEPPQQHERRLRVDDALARLPRLDIAYKVPPGNSNADDALVVLATILAGGRSSRLYETVVRQQQLAADVSVSWGERRGPGLLRLVVTPVPGGDIDTLEAAIDEEVERLKTAVIADWEIEKARTKARWEIVTARQSSLQRAVQLSQYALFYDDPGRINARANRLAAITSAEVQRVARTYLTRENRTVVVTVPKQPAEGRGRL